jgi:hypothetical protein
MLRILCAAALACLLATAAEARQRHHIAGAERSCIPTNDTMRPCAYQPDFLAGVKSIRVTMRRERHPANPRPRLARQTVSYSTPEIVAHPTGCPRSAFCGCGAAVRIFGHSVRDLWLAANWFKFPRAAPAPGMAAVRRHHVMVLEADLGGGVWRVFDANSGHHLTRVHARSIAGYQIVNPHAG